MTDLTGLFVDIIIIIIIIIIFVVIVITFNSYSTKGVDTT